MQVSVYTETEDLRSQAVDGEITPRRGTAGSHCYYF